jgi:Holliday junction resolvasome RuvABC DNA-binding subunit
LSNLSDYQLTRLAQRAEEEAELNRAILMSLQYANNPSSSTSQATVQASTLAGSGADNSGRNQNVDTLMSMGFTREQSVQALRETRDSVELAANRLLGLDL